MTPPFPYATLTTSCQCTCSYCWKAKTGQGGEHCGRISTGCATL